MTSAEVCISIENPRRVIYDSRPAEITILIWEQISIPHAPLWHVTAFLENHFLWVLPPYISTFVFGSMEEYGRNKQIKSKTIVLRTGPAIESVMWMVQVQSDSTVGLHDLTMAHFSNISKM